MHLPLKKRWMSATSSSCCSAFCSRSLVRRAGLGAFGCAI